MRVRALAGVVLLATVTLSGTPAQATPPPAAPAPQATPGLRAVADRAGIRIGTAVDMTALADDTAYRAGRAGNAVALGSDNGYVSLPAGILSGAGDFTIATWVRLNSLDPWARVFDFGTGTGTSVNMFLTPRSSAGTARFAITNASAGAEQQINGPSALPTGVWTHVAVVLAGSTGVLYVNGAEVARNSAINLRPTSLGVTSQNYLGRSQYADPYLNGALDSVRIHGQALSANDITNPYTGGG